MYWRCFTPGLVVFIALCQLPLAQANYSISEAIPIPVFAQKQDTSATTFVIAGSNIKLVERQGEWSQIITGDGFTGWVKSDLVSNRLTRLQRLQQLQKNIQQLQLRLNNQQKEISYLNQRLQANLTRLRQCSKQTIELNNKISLLTSVSKEQMQQRINRLQQQIEFQKINQKIHDQALRKLHKEENQTFTTLAMLGLVISFFMGFLVRAFISRTYRQF